MEDLYRVGEKWLKTAASTTSTIASTTSAIVATSGARAFGIIGSSSGRPEVPARAAAAAAVARKIVALPPHERLSVSSSANGTPSVCASRSGGRIAEELEDDFYEEGFDPIRHALEQLPQNSGDINQQYFDMKVGGRLIQLDIVAESLSKQVMENHEQMVNGMQLVTELDKDLQLTSIICKNGRRFLSMAAQEVTQDLLVAENVSKKQLLLDLLPVLDRVQLAVETKSRLDGTAEDGNYALALELCIECVVLLEDCSDLKAVMEVKCNLEEWLQKTINRIDSLLLQVCHDFDAMKFTPVLLSYIVLDDVRGLAEKAQTFYAQIIVSETYLVIRNLLFEGKELQGLPQKTRVPYTDLCCQLPEPKFKECLHRSLEVLFNVLSSYYQMMTWKPLIVREELSTTIGMDTHSVVTGKHRRSGSQGDLISSPQDNRHVRTGSHGLPTHHLQGLATTSNHLHLRGSVSRFRLAKDDLLIRNDTGSDILIRNDAESKVSKEVAVAKEQTTSVVIDNNASPSVPMNYAMLGVSRALERGCKTVWELSARRVAVLLSCDALCATSPHQFLQSLDWVNKFILVGEAFSGSEALTLRAKLVKQSEKYYWTFHRQNLEVLRVILGKELWQQISSLSVDIIYFKGLVNGAPIAKVAEGGLQSQGGSSQQKELDNSSLIRRVKPTSAGNFEELLRRGNPFTNRKIRKFVSVKTNENGMAKTGRVGASQGDYRLENVGDEEIEDEDLLADFIDEDSQLPGHLLTEYGANPSKITPMDPPDRSLILTSSTVSLLRYMDKYVKLMQILQPIVSEVFRGLCQLYELYVFTVFKVFGQRDFLPPSLMSALVRISQGLEEQRVQLSTQTLRNRTLPPSSPISFTNSQFLSDPPPSYTSTVVMVPSNLFALKERTVAAESLLCLSQILEKSYLGFKSMLPEDTLAYMEQFFTEMVELVPDLRVHMYKVVARSMLNIGGYVDRIGSARWELKELGVEHNGYIDLLLGEFKQYTNKLSQGSVSKEVQETLVEYGVDVIAETILEGLSRVKKCNNEGRALMSLDLQVLINGLHHLASPKLKLNLQIVETYIKAFYLPETEYFHWIRAHPEYTRSQVVGLINLVASAYNWKRKTRVDLLEKVEIGDQ